MIAKSVYLDAFHIVGISVRTSNQNGQSQADIGKLWQQFYSGDVAGKVAGKLTDDLYCLYTDYESDHNGAYTTVLGYKVDGQTQTPDGLVRVIIPAGTYGCYTSEGKLPGCVIDTWQHIWQTVTDRSFVADFDVYGPDAQDSDHAIVQTFLSLKPAT